jgi:hypothetical protein
MQEPRTLKRVSREVFNHVDRAASPLRPSQLVDALAKDYRYADLQDALSILLEDKRISLTSDRHLVSAVKRTAGR